MKTYTDFNFIKALPVWECGKTHEKNITLSAVAKIPRVNATLSLSAASSYVITVNGKFIAHGPARCGHGYYRVDQIDLTEHLNSEVNYVAIRTAGYSINSFSYLDVPSFVCAEIISDGEVIAFTGENGAAFEYYHVDERIQKVEKFSFQRTFVESYKLSDSAFAYEYSDTDKPTVKIENSEPKSFIERAIPYGDYELLLPKVIGRGTVSYSEKDSYFTVRQITDIGPDLMGYTINELEDKLHVDLGMMDFSPMKETCEDSQCISLTPDTYVDLDFIRNYAGLFTFELESDGGVLYFTFDEIRSDTRGIDEFRMCCSNIIKWSCKKGSYLITCAEPYTLKYLRIIAKGGNVRIKNLCMKKIAFPSSKITKKLKSDDPTLNKIFDAAVETFAANTVDIYMDCPSRERAGWLCDSFFTSRVEHVLTGRSEVERAFLENFLLPEKFKCLPDGMLPMCYPSDHYDGSFIPNWAMWYVMELGEYLERTGDRDFIDAAKDKVYALLNYFKPFENEYGLLEKLENWVFVEWSKANQLTQEVNFPSNMLYSGVKATASRLYNDAKLGEEAEKLKLTVREMAMTESGFFCDNANRVDGKLVLSGERTEACQYYAFYFGIAERKTHPWLFETLINDFSYNRRTTKKFPEIYFANAFIGNYLRLDIISRHGLNDILLQNIKDYFTYMADMTGTLWENETNYASCNHGFASHVIYWFDKLGMCE
ncbi:MAG: hypothetical protein IJ391_01620 [Clostridia bacterium]|nr:hypothetical protein [Clostridia bacterium]